MNDVLAALSLVGPVVVGVVFLATGLLKALAPSRFRRHLTELDLIPAAWLGPTAMLVASCEGLVGVALLVRVAPEWLFPATLVLLLALIGLTAWNAITKRTEDCGCYGGVIELSPWQSLVLDVLYALLVVVAWLYPVQFDLVPTRQPVVGVIAAILATMVTLLSVWSLRRQGRDLVDLSPLQHGRRWNPRWLDNYPDPLTSGSHLVVFLALTCSACKRWLRPLNVIHNRLDLPPVIAALVGSTEDVNALVTQHALAFPVTTLKASTMRRLVDAVPTIAVIRDGVVESKDTAQLPPGLVERLKQPAERNPTQQATPIVTWGTGAVTQLPGEGARSS